MQRILVTGGAGFIGSNFVRHLLGAHPDYRVTVLDKLTPRSPYSASKAGGDLQCLGFFHSHGLPVSITRASNTIGPFQYPEKLVPLMATNALLGLPLPVYGDGRQVRDCLHVAEHCAAIDLVLHRGRSGEVYNLGVGSEHPNIAVVELILAELGAPSSLIRHVADRQGHDRRYSLNSEKIRALGWSPQYAFERSIRETARWYAEQRSWWEPLRQRGDYRRYYEQNYGHRLAAGASI